MDANEHGNAKHVYLFTAIIWNLDWMHIVAADVPQLCAHLQAHRRSLRCNYTNPRVQIGDPGKSFAKSDIEWENPTVAQIITIARHDKRKRLVLPDDFVAEAPYGEYIIREGKGRLSIVAIPPPRTRRTYKATAALEKKLREAKDSKELGCPPDFFTEPLHD